MTETLYERLGGKESIAAVVDRFYDRMLDDERVSHHFEDVDMQQQRAQQTLFLCSLTGGPVEYTGEDMEPAHDHLGITEAEFDVTVDHLEAALEAFDVPERERTEVLEAVAGFRADIVSA